MSSMSSPNAAVGLDLEARSPLARDMSPSGDKDREHCCVREFRAPADHNGKQDAMISDTMQKHNHKRMRRRRPAVN